MKEGVKLEAFLSTWTRDVYKGVQISSHYPPSRRFRNNMKAKRYKWGSEEIKKNVKMCAMLKVSPAFPVIIALLSIHEKPDKLRLCSDARCVNKFLHNSAFALENVGSVPAAG